MSEREIAEVPLKILVSKIGSGKTPLGGTSAYVNRGVALIRSQNVHFTGLRLDDVAFIDEHTDFEMRSSRVVPNDVLLNITGASIGRVTIAPPDIGRANVNQHVCIIRPLPSRASPRYICYALRQSKIQRIIESDEQGASRESLTFDQIGRFPIRAFSIAQQNAIADFLDARCAAIDAAIEKKERLLALLESRFRQSLTGLFAEATGESPPVRLKSVLRGPLAYGATESAIAYSEDMPRYLRITDITDDGDITTYDAKSLSVEMAHDYMLEDGDVLFARSGATVGKALLYRSSFGRCCYAGYLVRASTNRALLLPDLLWYSTMTDYYWQQINADKVTSTIPNFSAQRYANLQLLVPPPESQSSLAESLRRLRSNWHAQRTALTRSIAALREYRTALITAAVTGKLELPAAPTAAVSP